MQIVDSSGWIEFLRGDANAGEFEPALRDAGSLVVPSIVVLEVSRRLLQLNDEQTVLRALARMHRSEIAPLDMALASDAARVGVERGLAIADSIIYATTLAYGGTLWTQDSHFEGLPSVRYIPKNRSNPG